MFGYAISLLLIALGAILAFAVTVTVSGIALHTVGWIVLIVGIVGFVLSLILYSDWSSRWRGRGPYDPEV
jgi:heme O synthase-like polyprenyltransferase